MTKVEAKPHQLPLWVIITWCVIFPGAFLITARFVFEQTYLTWARGAQMVGFSLAHQHVLFLFWGSASTTAAQIWLLIVAAILAKRRFKLASRWQWTAVGLTAFTLGLSHVPYAAWELAMSRVPGAKISRDQPLRQAVFNGQLSLVK